MKRLYTTPAGGPGGEDSDTAAADEATQPGANSGAVPDARPADEDDHLGAVEGDRPSDHQMGNRNLPALDEDGRPKDRTRICEDVIGANTDETKG